MRRRDADDAHRLMLELHFLPSVTFPGAAHRWPGVCLRCGHHGNPRFNNARRRGGACKYCKAQGANVDLAVAEGTMLAADFQPLVPFTNASTPWEGVCTRCGRPGAPRLATVKYALSAKASLTACGFCSASPNKVDPGHVYEVMRAAGFEPSVPYISALAPWPGVCLRCGHPGSPSYANVNARGGACCYCARQRVDDAVAYGTVLARDFLPDGPYPGGSKQPWPGVCVNCGTPGSPTYDTARVSGVCRTCGTYGYKTAEPGYLYLMERPGEQQIGITNNPAVRLNHHARAGWSLVDLMGPMAGQRALSLESELKRWIAHQRFILSGTRENWSTADLSVGRLTELLDLIGANQSPG